MTKDIITMSMNELKRLHLIKKTEEKLMTQAEAAAVLHISERQFRRNVKRFRFLGEQGLIHRSRGRLSPKKTSKEKVHQIITIYKKEFMGYKPTFFTEKLGSEYNITTNKETVRQLLTAHNLWTIHPKKCHYRSKRERKHFAGELVQLDGSVHQWFEGPEGYCVLMLYIDDATSRVYARFYTYEGTLPAMDSFRRYIQRYGIPIALYADLHSTYKNNNKTLSLEEQIAGQKALTQFSRALSELSVSIIPAFSPQAKGRVERSYLTFQDRLCKELRRHGIRSLKEANIFLDIFLKDHNARFSVKPIEQSDMHRPALPVYTLNKILCIKTERAIAKDFTIRHHNHILQLKESTISRKAVVEQHTNGALIIRINNKSVPFKDITSKFTKSKTFESNQSIVIDPVSLKEVAVCY